MPLPLRKELVGLQPYGAPQLDVPIRLNVNENPYPLSAKVQASIVQAVSRCAANLNRYPDRDFGQLREALSGFLEKESLATWDQDLLWVANGSNEVMTHLFQAFGGPEHTCLVFAPTYSMYPEYARDTCTQYVSVPREADFSINMDKTRRAIEDTKPGLILLTSPNNPTGTALSEEEITLIAQMARENGPAGSDCVVVVDEAYGEFRQESKRSALHLLKHNEHLVVARTMSKAFGMAGLRVGYAAAHQTVIDAVKLVRLPYHLSATTQAIALAALEHADELLEQVAQIKADRDTMVASLRNLGLKTCESDANFVMFGTFTDRHCVFSALLDRGVLIREVGPEGWLRVSVGTPAENDAFITALQEVL